MKRSYHLYKKTAEFFKKLKKIKVFRKGKERVFYCVSISGESQQLLFLTTVPAALLLPELEGPQVRSFF